MIAGFVKSPGSAETILVFGYSKGNQWDFSNSRDNKRTLPPFSAIQCAPPAKKRPVPPFEEWWCDTDLTPNAGKAAMDLYAVILGMPVYTGFSYTNVSCDDVDSDLKIGSDSKLCDGVLPIIYLNKNE